MRTLLIVAALVALAPASAGQPLPAPPGPAPTPSAVPSRQAGFIPEEVTATVTGDPPSLALVREAVERRLDQAVTREPGAVLTLGTVPPLDETILHGYTVLRFLIHARLRSPYAAAVERLVRVTVVRQEVEIVDPHVLLISNRPETVRADGILFQEVVDEGHATRLLYHHLNGTPHHSRILSVALTNRSDQPAQLLFIRGLAGPSPDPLYVGFASTSRFLQDLAAARGYILDLPGRSSYAFTAQAMPALQLVSGILQLQLLAGEQLEVKVSIRSPWLLDRTVTTEVNQVSHPHPKGTFRGATVAVAREVVVNGTPAPIGDLGVSAGLRDVRTGEPLVGDYGVLYRYTITATNPSEADMITELVVVASGGLARGIFLVDGRLIETALLRPYGEQVLTSGALGPKETRVMRVLTMPIGGSYYPVRIFLRSRPSGS